MIIKPAFASITIAICKKLFSCDYCVNLNGITMVADVIYL